MQLELAPPPAVNEQRIAEMLASLDNLREWVKSGRAIGITVVVLESDYGVQNWTLTTRDIPLVQTLGALAWAQYAISHKQVPLTPTGAA